ncbi:hypothetical protein DSO57_1002063 [Entomophthora muscae]|uniref:Uncharacterized protein n=1 Tax=Entomophthora muscae TaxID=34485 RepID=A0ACC2RZX1_9FUNG|nr:hypothetical protein DSO57_1002063 [Entomophthora muscae]
MSGSAYQPSTPKNTVLQLSTMNPKKTSKSITPASQAGRSIHSSLSTRLVDLNAKDVPSTTIVIQEDKHGKYIDMNLYVCWDSIPRLQLCGSFAMWPILMLTLEHSYIISTQKLEVGNTVHWWLPIPKLMDYSRIQLDHFSFDGMSLLSNQKSCALELLNVIFFAWMNPKSFTGPAPLYNGSDSHKYCLQRAMSATLDLPSYKDSGSQQFMMLVGNLVLCGSKSVYHQRFHHMSEYLKWLLTMMYSVGGKTPEEYAQQESLLWECILLGIAFPYFIGINCVRLLPVDSTPFLPYSFHCLPSVWLIYAASVQILLQLRLAIEELAP